MRGITYTIRSSLYVAVTNRCCTTSLIASRGPGLSMPPSFRPLPADVEPSAADILQGVTERLAVRDANSGAGKDVGLFDEVVFAGVGEPLLRWSVVKEAVNSLRHRHADLLLRPRERPTTKSATASAAAAAPAAASVAAADRTELVHGKSSTTSAASSYTTMPVRLVTNGLWSVASGQVLGSCCPTVDASESTGTPAAAAPVAAPAVASAAAARLQRRGRREGDASGGDEGDVVDSAAQAAQRNSQSITGSDTSETGGGSKPEAEVSAASVASEIAELFDSVSVALNTADPLQYEELMKPSAQGISRRQRAHSLVCDLVKECVAQGLQTECTVVDRDGVDVERAEELAAALGASCRVRPYFP